MARPRELTDKIITEAADLVKRCLYVETVAASLGIHKDTFYDWLKTGSREARRRDQGKEPNSDYDKEVRFSDAVKKAMAEAESDYLSVIQAAGTEAWQALAWILERRFPQRWATNRGELRALAKQIAAVAQQGTKGAQSVRGAEAQDTASATGSTASLDSVE